MLSSRAIDFCKRNLDHCSMFMFFLPYCKKKTMVFDHRLAVLLHLFLWLVFYCRYINAKDGLLVSATWTVENRVQLNDQFCFRED